MRALSMTDGLYDYRARRPTLHIHDGHLVSAAWPKLTVLHRRFERRDVLVLSGSGELPSIAGLESALARTLGRYVPVTVEYYPSAILTAADQNREADTPAVEESE